VAASTSLTPDPTAATLVRRRGRGARTGRAASDLINCAARFDSPLWLIVSRSWHPSPDRIIDAVSKIVNQ
jgi:hypothetical protein